MTIVQIHIERTGGVSIQNLYEKKYPGPEMIWYSVRDGLFSPFNIKTANYTVGWHLKVYAFISSKLPFVRKIMLMIRAMRRKKQALQLSELSKHAELVIGHFSIEQVNKHLHPDSNKYRTVVRDPLTRMWSHYCYWKTHRGDVGHRVSPTYNDDLTFEEFALLPELVNYQTQAVGEDLSVYDYIGITDRLDEFAVYAGLISKEEQVPLVNNFSEELPSLSDQFLATFRETHEDDYGLYEYAENLYR